jgi:hypothetical protein
MLGRWARTLNESTLLLLDEVRAASQSDLYKASQSGLKARLGPLDAAIQILERHQEPAPDTVILKSLEGMAEMFQVAIPDTVGLELYVRALKILPRPAFVRARDNLLRTHKYARLPYPADFVREGSETVSSLNAAINFVKGQRRRLAHTLAHHPDRNTND